MVDWSLARPMPDFFGTAQNAFLAGQKQSEEKQRRNALAGYSSNPEGTRNALLNLGDIETVGALSAYERNNTLQQQQQADRAARVAAAEKYAAGDTKGAVGALGPTGDLQSIATLQDQGRQETAAQFQYRQEQAARLQSALVQGGPEAMIQAFDASIPDYKANGLDDAGVATLRQALLTNPRATLDAVAAPPKVGFHTAGNSLFITNDTTGEVMDTREGTRQVVLPEGGTLVETGRGAADAGPTVDIASAERAVLGIPGTQVTSGQRSAAHNAEVGGVPNSYHLTGQARDFRIPQGQSSAQFAASVRQRVGAGWDVIDEGNHVHIEPAKRPAQGGARVVARGAPKPGYRPATPADLAAYPNLDPSGTYQIGPHGEIKPVGPSGDMTPRQAAQTSIQLRSQFNGEADVKAFNDVAGSYEQVTRLAKKANPTSADDTALTFSFMKMLDPGSVVREGEFALVGQGAGLPDQVVRALAMVDKGKVLTPQIRQRLVQAATSVYEGRKGRYEQLVGQYGGYAKDLGLPEGTIAARIPAGSSKPAGSAAGQAPVKLGANPDAAYARLPKGALYVGPDGVTRRK